MDFKKIGQQALADNKHLQEVFVTSDGIPFVDRNSAVNHSVKLDDKTIEKVVREQSETKGGEQNETKGGKSEKVSAEELIGLIRKLTTIEEYNSFDLPEGEKRPTVVKALADKKKELGVE